MAGSASRLQYTGLAEVQYQDLIQLLLFPDGSPLSSRLKNAAIFQNLCNQDQATHEKAVTFASQLNQQAPAWIHQQLRNFHQGKPLWQPRFMPRAPPRLEGEWHSKAEKRLQLLLYDGLEALVGFSGELRVRMCGFKMDGRMNAPRTQNVISTIIYVEDASGVQQGGALVGSDVTADGDVNRHVLDVTGEDYLMRVQVFSSPPDMPKNRKLVGELRVSLTSLPSNGAQMELDLPMFLPTSDTPAEAIPVYKAHRSQLLAHHTEHVQTGTLHCIIAYTADSGSNNPEDEPNFGNERSMSSTPASHAVMVAVRMRILSSRSKALPETHWPGSKGHVQSLARLRWAEAITKVLVQNAMLSLRSNASQEVVRAMNSSPVFGAANAEQVFMQLMDQVWDMWARHSSMQQGADELRTTPSLQSLPTMARASVGGIDVQRQPLYLILRKFDRHLDAVMQDPHMANEHVPGMPFFHLVFIFAMLRGISPWLVKLMMAKHILSRLQMADGPVLRFLKDVSAETYIAQKQQLLTETEDRMCTSVNHEFRKCIRALMEEHLDRIPPQDAAARKLVLQQGQKHSTQLKEGQLASFLTTQASQRMDQLLQTCNVHRVEHALSVVRSAKTYEAVHTCLQGLGKAWTKSAAYFEACLGLKFDAKEMLKDWHVNELLHKHYEALCRATQALIENSPFWPYDDQLGYKTQDMSKLQEGLEATNSVLEKFGLGERCKNNPHSLKIANYFSESSRKVGAYHQSTGSQLPGDVQGYHAYRVKVFTGNIKGAGTDSTVYINIHGDVKSSGKCALTKEKAIKKTGKIFEVGSADEFQIMVRGNLGNLHNLEISIDGAGNGHSWYLDRVEVTSPEPRQVWYFACQTWLSRTRGDCKLECMLSGTLEPPSARQTTYKVEVKTADIKGAGTNARVYIRMFGSTGKHAEFLKRRLKTDFDRGQYALFTITCQDLGNIEKIELGIKPNRTGSSSSQGSLSADGPQSFDRDGKKEMAEEWHLEFVIVTNTKNNAKWLFKVGDKFNRLVPTREIYPIDEEDLAEYRVHVTTADEPTAGLGKGHAYVVLEGSEGVSGMLPLEEPRDIAEPPFQSSQTSVFSLYWRDVGQLTGLRVGQDGSGRSILRPKGYEWHVQRVVVIDVNKAQQYTFNCNFKLGGSQLEKTASKPIVEIVEVRKVVTYQVTTYTSNIRKAGTDARVFIEIFGENRLSSEKQQLVNKSKLNLFEMGQVDTFTIKCQDLGALEKVVIGHDNSKLGAAWHLDRVEVLDTRANKQYIFSCGRWLSERHGSTECTLYPQKAPPPPVTGSRDLQSSGDWDEKLTLMNWTTLMWPKVEKQIEIMSAITPAAIARMIEDSQRQEWEPVSLRYLHAKHAVALTQAVVGLLDACSQHVIQNITHSNLRVEVASSILLYALQPLGMKVIGYLQKECLEELHKLHQPGTPADEKPSLFELTQPELQPMCIRINTLLHHSTTVRNELSRFEQAAGAARLTPADRMTLRSAHDRVQRSLASRSAAVLGELRGAMRFSFGVALEQLCGMYGSEQEEMDALYQEVYDLLKGSMDVLKQEWLSSEMVLLYNLFWSSLLEAVKGLLLGLSVWSLSSEFKMTSDQAELIEAVLKNLEHTLETEGEWKPVHSLLDATNHPYMRKLLSAAREDSQKLYRQLHEQTRQDLSRLSEVDAEPRLPYFGMEVASSVRDIVELQQSSGAELAVLDLVRLLRSRPDEGGSRGFRKGAEEHVQFLHSGKQIQVLFGLPFSQELTFSLSLNLLHKHPAPASSSRPKVLVTGQLYVFTTFVAFTTLIRPANPAPVGRTASGTAYTQPGATSQQVLACTDYTTLWRAAEDILHLELVQAGARLLITLSDHSTVELWCGEVRDLATMRELHRKVSTAMGLVSEMSGALERGWGRSGRVVAPGGPGG